MLWNVCYMPTPLTKPQLLRSLVVECDFPAFITIKVGDTTQRTTLADTTGSNKKQNLLRVEVQRKAVQYSTCVIRLGETRYSKHVAFLTSVSLGSKRILG